MSREEFIDHLEDVTGLCLDEFDYEKLYIHLGHLDQKQSLIDQLVALDADIPAIVKELDKLESDSEISNYMNGLLNHVNTLLRSNYQEIYNKLNLNNIKPLIPIFTEPTSSGYFTNLTAEEIAELEANEVTIQNVTFSILTRTFGLHSGSKVMRKDDNGYWLRMYSEEQFLMSLSKAMHEEEKESFCGDKRFYNCMEEGLNTNIVAVTIRELKYLSITYVTEVYVHTVRVALDKVTVQDDSLLLDCGNETLLLRGNRIFKQ